MRKNKNMKYKPSQRKKPCKVNICWILFNKQVTKKYTQSVKYNSICPKFNPGKPGDKRSNSFKIMLNGFP